MWGDVENAVATWLRGRMPGVRVANEIPANLENVVPVVVVRVVPGGGNDRITDTCPVDVECFGADRDAMWALAAQAHEHLLAASGAIAGGLLLDSVATQSRPGEVPYGNPGVRRAIASYEVDTRPVA